MSIQLNKRLPSEIVAMIAQAAVETALESRKNNPQALAIQLAAQGCADLLLADCGKIAGVIVPKNYFERTVKPAVIQALNAAN